MDKNSILDVADSEKEKAKKTSAEAEKAEHEEAPVEQKEQEAEKAEDTKEVETPEVKEPDKPASEEVASVKPETETEAEKSTTKKDDDEDVEESSKEEEEKEEKEKKEKSLETSADIIKSITEPLNQFKEELKKSDDSLKEELSKTNNNLEKAIDTLSGLAQAIQDVVGAGQQKQEEAPKTSADTTKSVKLEDDNDNDNIVAKSAEPVSPVVAIDGEGKEKPEPVDNDEDSTKNTVYKALQIEPQYVDRYVDDSRNGKLSEVQKSYLNSLSREVHYRQTDDRKDYDDFIKYAETGEIPEIPTDYFG